MVDYRPSGETCIPISSAPARVTFSGHDADDVRRLCRTPPTRAYELIAWSRPRG